MPSRDIEARRATSRRWYQRNKNKPEQFEARRLKRIRKRKHIKAQIQAYKEGCGCGFCGESFADALEFHHVDPATKEMAVSRGVLSYTAAEEEIRKCEVLCSNCHKKIHVALRLQEQNHELFKKLMAKGQ